MAIRALTLTKLRGHCRKVTCRLEASRHVALSL